MVSRDGLVRDAYESELPRVLGMLAAIWQIVFGIQVLGYLHEYREPSVPLVVWLGLLVVARWLVPRTRVGDLTGWEAAFAIMTAVTAVSLCGWADRLPGAVGSVDWSVFGTSWLIALVAVSRPAWEWASGALLVFGAHVLFSAPVLGTPALGLTLFTATSFGLTVIGIIFAGIRPTVRTQARIAVRRAALESLSAAESAAVDAIRTDRREQLALLEMEALPLLRGIADGTFDPADPGVRERCARHAATLRRSLTGRDEVLPGLSSVLRAASARGLLVEVQLVGDVGEPEPAVAAATLAAVESVVSALQPRPEAQANQTQQPVMLTVLAAGDDVEVYVTFTEPLRASSDVARPGRNVPAAARWHAAVNLDETGAGCLEVSWRKVRSA
jgi:hypothetical protein